MNPPEPEYPKAVEITRRVEEFRALYKEIYGEQISEGEATAIISRILPLYRQLMLKLPSEQEIKPPDAPSQP